MRQQIRRWFWRLLFGPFLAAELERIENEAVMGPFAAALRAGYGIECNCPEVHESYKPGSTVKVTYHRPECPVAIHKGGPSGAIEA